MTGTKRNFERGKRIINMEYEGVEENKEMRRKGQGRKKENKEEAKKWIEKRKCLEKKLKGVRGQRDQKKRNEWTNEWIKRKKKRGTKKCEK